MIALCQKQTFKDFISEKFFAKIEERIEG